MAHNLEFNEQGEACIAYVGDAPWHKLGKKVLGDLTPDQFMKEAQLDWEVRKVPLYADIGGDQVRSGAEALVRSTDNKILDVVTDNWNPCQNKDAFEFFNDFISAGEMSMDTAGALDEGRLVWALAKTNDSFELFGGDRVESYLLFSNPHKFGKAIDVRMTGIRVVCNNTLTLALSEASKQMVKISHRRQFDADEVKLALGIAAEKLSKYKEMAEFLGSKKFTGETAVEYFNRVFPKVSDRKNQAANNNEVHSKAAKIALSIVETQPGAEYAAGSFWTLFNAATHTTTHLLGRSDETRLQSSWFGVNQNKNVQALNIAAEMAEAA
jgi:phage/plasmid-like protein (TIGR03299 family)